MADDRDWTGADETFQRALSLEPDNANIMGMAASMARNLGRLDEAIRLDQHVVQLDPVSASRHVNLGLSLYSAGQCDEAVASLEKSLELSPERVITWTLLGMVRLAQALPEEALSAMEREPDEAFREFGLAMAYHALRQEAEADVHLDWLIREDAESGAYQIAEVHGFRGRLDEAFEWPERAYSARDQGMVNLEVDPLFASLRDDPRWNAMLRKNGLAD